MKLPTPLLAFAIGAASVFAYAPFGIFPLAFVCWGALFWMLRTTSPRRAAVLGMAWGFGAFLAGLSWLYIALNRYGNMPMPLAVLALALFCFFLSIYPALSSWLFARVRQGIWWQDAALAAATWTLGEWLRGTVFTGFPWLAIGYSQTAPSPLAGFAPVLGNYGMSWLLAFVAACAVMAMIDARVRFKAIAVCLVVLAAGAGLRLVHWTSPVGEPTRFSLLQTNIDQALKWDRDRIMDWLRLNLDLVRQHPAQVIVLPETTLPLLQDQLPEGYAQAMSAAATSAGGNVVLGLFTQDANGGIYNSAVTLGPGTPQQYSKQHLVPFGEFSPPMFDWFYRLASIPMSDQMRGPRNPAPLQLGGQKIAVNICYEDVFGEELLYALPDATLMLNISNLAWYGRSHAQAQHLQIARVRAMETGRPMLRATNTGMTAIVQPDGTVSEVLPAFTTGAITADVRGYGGMTPFARWSNTPVLLISVLIIALAAYSARSRRSSAP